MLRLASIHAMPCHAMIIGQSITELTAGTPTHLYLPAAIANESFSKRNS
jgi:hypothetical protein